MKIKEFWWCLPISALASVDFSILDFYNYQRRWDWNTDPLPPIQPKECFYQQEEANNYTFTANHYTFRDSFIAGYSYESDKHLSVVVSAGGNNNQNPVALISFTNFTSPNDPKAGLQIMFHENVCNYWEVEGGSNFPGYDFYLNQILSLNATGGAVYYTNYTDPSKNLGPVLYFTAPLVNAGGIVNYTTAYSASTGLLLYYIADGYQYCCEDFCSGNLTASCREGSNAPHPQYTRSTTIQYRLNHLVYPESYLWPIGLFTKPSCPYATSYCNGGTLCSTQQNDPSVSSTCDDDQKMRDVAVGVGVSLGVLLLISWVLFFAYRPATAPATITLPGKIVYDTGETRNPL